MASKPLCDSGTTDCRTAYTGLTRLFICSLVSDIGVGRLTENPRAPYSGCNNCVVMVGGPGLNARIQEDRTAQENPDMLFLEGNILVLATF